MTDGVLCYACERRSRRSLSDIHTCPECGARCCSVAAAAVRDLYVIGFARSTAVSGLRRTA